jgi:hypothetical protein
VIGGSSIKLACGPTLAPFAFDVDVGEVEIVAPISATERSKG